MKWGFFLFFEYRRSISIMYRVYKTIGRERERKRERWSRERERRSRERERRRARERESAG